jgi:hypothetical protein
MKRIKTVWLPETDPRREFKLNALEWLGATAVFATEQLAQADLWDLTGLSAIENFPKGMPDELLHRPGQLVAGEVATENRAIYWPLRYWGVVEKIRGLLKQNAGGELTSLRLFWSEPTGAAGEYLAARLLDFLDLAEFLAASPLKTLQAEATSPTGGYYLLGMHENEVALEVEFNCLLPTTLEPMRFLKANCTRGIFTNQPVVGHHNVEGSLWADASGVRHLLCEGLGWSGTDEIENLYLRQLQALDEEKLETSPAAARRLIDLLKQTLPNLEAIR